MLRPDFQTLFCQRFKCTPSQFEERAFHKLLYWHAKPLAPLLRRLNPNFFKDDVHFVSYLGAATSVREVQANAADFKDTIISRRSFLRTSLRIRISGMKAIKLARRLSSQAPPPV